MNHDALKNEFKKKGFVLFKGLFQEDKISKITNISEKIVEKASSVNIPWPYIRIYRDYPEFNNKKNIFGVDYPLNHKLDQNIFDEVQKLDYKNFIINFLGWKNFCSKFVRLHTNSSFYNYQGEWHRDDINYPTPDAIQLILYLKAEKGFRIVPKYKNDLLENYGFSKRGSLGFSKLPEELYETIDAEKGDVLIFESCLLHQGFCKKKRLHYHFRHEREDILDNSNNRDFLNFVKEYKKDYNLDDGTNRYVYKEISKIYKYRVFLLYFLPRLKSVFNNARKKLKQSIFHSTIWQ
tara:strand:+ start:42 stop:920 length:879 start_codon:yes stop_codon:yes gene_type:complete